MHAFFGPVVSVARLGLGLGVESTVPAERSPLLSGFRFPFTSHLWNHLPSWGVICFGQFLPVGLGCPSCLGRFFDFLVVFLSSPFPGAST